MEKLLDQNTVGIYKKIHSIMGELEEVQKKGWNETQHYSYVIGSDLIQAVKPCLIKHGLILHPTVNNVSTSSVQYGKGVATLTSVEVLFTLADIETGAFIQSVYTGQGIDSGDKGVYKAYTGAIKYFFTETFLIHCEDNNDPEHCNKNSNNKYSNKNGTNNRYANNNNSSNNGYSNNNASANNRYPNNNNNNNNSNNGYSNNNTSANNRYSNNNNSSNNGYSNNNASANNKYPNNNNSSNNGYSNNNTNQVISDKQVKLLFVKIKDVASLEEVDINSVKQEILSILKVSSLEECPISRFQNILLYLNSRIEAFQ